MASTDFTKLVPGFDFLQNLMQGASAAAMPNISQWIAPTLDPDEIDKRIGELKTVQFWLEQNARMLAATIQALEVQRMTLATLKTMNMPMTEMRDALKLRSEPAPAPRAEPEPEAPAELEAAAAPKPPMADPVQWWTALTQQFTELATNAMKDGRAAAAALTATPPAASAPAAEDAEPPRSAPASPRSRTPRKSAAPAPRKRAR